MDHQNLKIVPQIFKDQVEKYGNRAIVSYKNSEKKYVDISWNEMSSMVLKVSSYLLSQGVKKGDTIGIFSNNRPEWWIADLAIISIGATTVPIYATNSADESHYILEHSEALICFTGNNDQFKKIISIKNRLPKFKKVISFSDMEVGNKDTLKLSDILADSSIAIRRDEIIKIMNSITKEDLATIIYTSGTTGNPKGVMLSHGNFAVNIYQQYEALKEYLDDKQSFLSVLPLSHVFERNSGFYLPMAVGARVGFAEDTTTVVNDLKDLKPTILIGVPRIYEKMHGAVLAGLADAPPSKKKMFNKAMTIATKNVDYICNNKKRKGFFKLKYNLYDKLIFSKLKNALGMSNLNFAVSGGGPLSVTNANFFLGMDIKVLEGYGLTETSPSVANNRPWLIKPGTVGCAYPMTEVKISDEGEILIKGPQIMKGYFKNPKATIDAFTPDGWFRSGDIGIMDEKGYIKITDRMKDIIITSGGKNISPQNIENSIKTSIYIEQAAVIGDRRKYLTALIVPTFDILKKWAHNNNIQFNSNKDLINNDAVINLIDSEIKSATEQFSRVEGIKKFKILDTLWTQETGELTPTQKVKRRIIEKKYEKEIESMYRED